MAWSGRLRGGMLSGYHFLQYALFSSESIGKPDGGVCRGGDGIDGRHARSFHLDVVFDRVFHPALASSEARSI